jgi:hypothetical protein
VVVPARGRQLASFEMLAQAWAVGSFYLALLPGVMAQWLIDPDHAPSGRDLAEALRTIVGDVTAGQVLAQE